MFARSPTSFLTSPISKKTSLEMISLERDNGFHIDLPVLCSFSGGVDVLTEVNHVIIKSWSLCCGLILDVTSLHYGGIMFFDRPCPSASHLTIESSLYIHIRL